MRPQGGRQDGQPSYTKQKKDIRVFSSGVLFSFVGESEQLIRSAL